MPSPALSCNAIRHAIQPTFIKQPRTRLTHANHSLPYCTSSLTRKTSQELPESPEPKGPALSPSSSREPATGPGKIYFLGPLTSPTLLARSMLVRLPPPSRLALTLPLLTLLLLLVLLRRRVSSGSAGLSPLALAYKFSTSVRLTTPVRRPLRAAPGREELEMPTPGFAGV